MQKTCAICDSPYEAKTNRSKYCTTACKDKGKPSATGLNCSICNKPMVKGRTSQPQGQAAHRACRTGMAYPERGPGLVHGSSGYRRGCRCETCAEGQAQRMRLYADTVKARAGVNPSTLSRRKYRDANGYWPQTGGSDWIDRTQRIAIYERDNWTCQICGEDIDRERHWNDDMAPSLDHIIPRSHMLIPDHSQGNLRTAHRRCNAVRGDRIAA